MQKYTRKGGSEAWCILKIVVFDSKLVMISTFFQLEVDVDQMANYLL